MKKFLTILISVVLIPVAVFAYTSPGKPTGYVNDFANVLNPDTRAVIENTLIDYNKTGVAQISVVTVKSLGDETIENYAVKLFKEWGIGDKKKDNGLLILVAPNDRQARIEVGYGLEGAVTDLQASNIINKVMFPQFKNDDYGNGVSLAVQAVIGVISKSPEAAIYSEASNSSSGSNLPGQLIVFIGIVIINVFGRLFAKTKSWWLGGVVGAGIGTVVGIIIGSIVTGVVATIVLTVIGLLFDYVVSNAKPGSGKGGGSSFLGGFGGGSSGGSSGFGGFGGGMSGGGGASGRW